MISGVLRFLELSFGSNYPSVSYVDGGENGDELFLCISAIAVVDFFVSF